MATSPIAMAQIAEAIQQAAGDDGHFAISKRELQRLFDEADAALPARLKEQHPARTIEEIEREYPDQWVAILVTSILGHGNCLAAGRVFAHSADWDTFEAQLHRLSQQHPAIARALTRHDTRRHTPPRGDLPPRR
jgi:hypothetical protein